MWFWYAITAAVLGSFENLTNKQAVNKVSPLLMTWAAFALNLPLVFLFLLKQGFSSFNYLFFVGTFGSSLTFVYSKLLKNQTLKNNDMSKIIPLTAFSSFFTYILGLVFLHQNIGLYGVSGLFLIMSGSYILNVDKAKEHILEPLKCLVKDKLSILYLLSMVMTSVAAIFDKVGLSNTTPPNASMELVVENIIMTTILTVVLINKEKNWVGELRNNFWILFIYSTIYGVVSLIVFLGIIDGPVALVMGVKKLELIFTLMLGYLFLNDKPPKHAWVATLIMVLGVVLVKVG